MPLYAVKYRQINAEPVMRIGSSRIFRPLGGMADTADLKSACRNAVPVRVREGLLSLVPRMTHNAGVIFL
jgi:hypothetical protein